MNEMSNEQVLSRCQEIVDNLARSQNIERENHLNRIMSAINVVLPKKIVDYVLLYGDPEILAEKVNKFIRTGWSVYESHGVCRGTISQAMVKYEDEK